MSNEPKSPEKPEHHIVNGFKKNKRRLKSAQLQNAVLVMENNAIQFIQSQQEIFEKPFKKRILGYALDVDNLEEFQLFANVVQGVCHQQQDMTPALQEAIYARLKQLNPAVSLNIQQTVDKAPHPSLRTSTATQSSPVPVHDDDTALRVVCNLLAGIDVKTRYKQADLKNKFGFASFKVIQHKDRAEQIRLLNLAVTKARENMLSNPTAAFSQLEGTISLIKRQLDQEKEQGKRKLGDSRLEKVIIDLSREVQGMRQALQVTSEGLAKKPPKVGGFH